MYIKIGKHPDWFGPYQLARLLCFWAKKEKDENGFLKDPNWVHNFGEFLAYGIVEPDAKVGEIRSTEIENVMSGYGDQRVRSG
jgi:hypothetical protein